MLEKKMMKLTDERQKYVWLVAAIWFLAGILWGFLVGYSAKDVIDQKISDTADKKRGIEWH